jgi:hypothetical protein
MSTDFDRWAVELAQDTEPVTVNCVCRHPKAQHEHHRAGNDCVVCGCMTYRAPTNINLTVTIGWLIILALTGLVFIGAWVVGTHIIQWVTS